jgi:flagellar motor switch protein FliG
MAEYSYNDIMKMQNDAIRRVNEMQKRAKSVVEDIKENTSSEFTEEVKKEYDTPKRVKMPNDYINELKGFASTSSHFEESEPEAVSYECAKEKKETYHSPKHQNDTLKNIFNDLNMDSDKALILSLVLLLTEEKADEMLILALLYILS